METKNLLNENAIEKIEKINSNLNDALLIIEELIEANLRKGLTISFVNIKNNLLKDKELIEFALNTYKGE